MKNLLLLTLLTLFTLTANSQNIVNNYTDKEFATEYIERGLDILGVKNTHVTIIPMTTKLYKKFRSNGLQVEAVTISGAHNVYTIILGNALTKTYGQLISHELIHIQQKYNGAEYIGHEASLEHEANNKGRNLAHEIRSM